MSPSADVGIGAAGNPRQGSGPNVAHEPQAVGPEEAIAGERGPSAAPRPNPLHEAESLWELL